MTDVEMKRLQAICDVANVDDIEDLSDGFHTFNDLYEQRMYLFAALVRAYKDRAWKSLRHEDGELCFGGGWFIVGIDTPEGSYTYHYRNKYFDLFDCQILDYARHWDGHTDKDVVRLMSLEPEQKAGENGYGAALNVACDLLNDNVINGHDRDLIFDEIMQDEGSVSSDSWRRYILSHMEVLE